MVHWKFKNGERYRSDTGLMGLAFDPKDLHKAVTENAGDMFECYYSHAVIEKVPVAVCAGYMTAEVVQWYKANWGDKENPVTNGPKSVDECDEPDWAKNVINWWG